MNTLTATDFSDRVAYTGPLDTCQFREHYYAGRIVYEDDCWWLARYHVSYDQSGVSTAKNFSCRAKADEEFERRLESIRKGWGHNGARWSEQSTNHVRGIRFRSIRKNSKPGTSTGVLYMADITSVSARCNN